MNNAHAYLINGSFDATITPLDRGFAYGDGVFRTLKVVNCVPQHWPLHYQKLVADCSVIGIVCPSPELLMNDIVQLCLPNETVVAKIIITRGQSERGYMPPAITTPMRVMMKRPMPTYLPEYTNQGVTLHVCDTFLAAQPKLAGIKHLNRLENVLARMEWSDPAIFDGIMLDTESRVIECTSANIFARFGKELLTPDLTQCGIAGITRQIILDTAHLHQLSAKIAPISLSELFSADEVIISNSLYGAFQVIKIGQHAWKSAQLAASVRKYLKYEQ
jgi:4-amino-4-deoxychorismate lyase